MALKVEVHKGHSGRSKRSRGRATGPAECQLSAIGCFLSASTPSPGHPPLHAAARDAEAMSARFTRGWGYDHRARHVLLLNQDATAARVTDEIQSARSAADLDLLLIYWAGHLHAAGRKHVLATHDASVDGGPAGIGLEDMHHHRDWHGARRRAPRPDSRYLPRYARLSPASGHVATCRRRGVRDGAGLGRLRPPDARGSPARRCPGSLLEQMPRESRGLPPGIDLLAAWRAGAEHFADAGRSRRLSGCSARSPSCACPNGSGKAAPVDTRARAGRHAVSRPSPVALS